MAGFGAVRVRARYAAVAAALAGGLLTGCSVFPQAPPPRLAATPGNTQTVQVGKVSRVVDGDTLRVVVNGAETTIRVIGVDTPETHKPNTQVQCYGPQATAQAKEIAAGRIVTVRNDPSQAQVDRYGRALRYIELPDGRDLSVAMVGGGFGRAYKVAGPAPVMWAQLVAAQQQAQQQKTGLWAPRPRGCGGGL